MDRLMDACTDSPIFYRTLSPFGMLPCLLPNIYCYIDGQGKCLWPLVMRITSDTILFLYIKQGIRRQEAKYCNTRVKSVRLSMNPIFAEACLLMTEAGGSLERDGCSLQELLKGCLDEPFGHLKFLCSLYFHVAFLIKAEAIQRPIKMGSSSQPKG